MESRCGEDKSWPNIWAAQSNSYTQSNVTNNRCIQKNDNGYVVHGPEQISVPSGWAKLGNVFYVHICPGHYLSHDRPLKLAAFMWLSSIFNISFSKNSIFVFFDDFQIIFKLRPSSMIVLIKYNCSNTSWYPFELYVSISLKNARIAIN